MASVDSREFTYWQAYDQLDPIGPQSTRRLIAEMVTLYLNVHLGKDARAARPEDFMPWCAPPEPPEPRRQSQAEMQRAVRMATGAV